MKIIWNGNCKRVFKDRPCLLEIHAMDPKIAFSFVIIPLKQLCLHSVPLVS